MAKAMSEYYNAFGVFKKKLSKRLNDDDVASLKLAGIASGLLLMSFIPDFTKKLRTLLLIFSIILIIPTIIKAIKLIRDMLT